MLCFQGCSRPCFEPVLCQQGPTTACSFTQQSVQLAMLQLMCGWVKQQELSLIVLEVFLLARKLACDKNLICHHIGCLKTFRQPNLLLLNNCPVIKQRGATITANINH